VSGSGAQRSSEAEFLLVGRIRKPHGIRGELFVWLETDRPETAFRDGQTLYLGDDGGPAEGKRITVERTRRFKDGYLVKVREHGGRDEALELLRGQSLYIRRSDAAPLEAGEVYYHDLIGLRVVAHGDEVGEVREVYEGPATDLLVVTRPGKPEALVPFVREIVRSVDIDAGVVEIEPPDGLLEI
jgi:16S rRNA processing protein RimM